mmetsp:Transcript_86715/g.260327  ORF Transcript_86715/g.260327 Transcript_86715/m.260327 type:complete len:244 (-) Transcript_86715:455-1186(-)
MLNPDGVAFGHCRADARGIDLNRMYAQPSHDEQPSVHAALAVAQQLHGRGDLYCYIDAHAHGNRRGCFFYANALPTESARQDAALYARLVALNARWLDVEGCAWKKSNKGSARGAMFAMTGLPLTFTLECNYDSGIRVNELLPRYEKAIDESGAGTDAALLAPEPPAVAGEQQQPEGAPLESAKYTPASWQEIGAALAVGILDLSGANPASRLGPPEGDGLQQLRASSKWFAEFTRCDEDDEG